MGQTSGLPANINFVDLSTGSDVTVTQRRIYLQLADGTFLVPSGVSTDYNLWGDFPATTTLTLANVLPKDEIILATCEWLTSAGAIVDSKILSLQGFSQFNENFLYGLTQMLAGNPLLFNDNNFKQEKSNVRDLVDSGNQAIVVATDQFGAQACYNLATDIRNASQYIFNENS